MNRRKHEGPREFHAAPSPAPLLTLGSNTEVRQVVIFFDDPTAPHAKHITFTAAQARGLGYGLIAEADKAEGRGTTDVS